MVSDTILLLVIGGLLTVVLFIIIVLVKKVEKASSDKGLGEMEVRLERRISDEIQNFRKEFSSDGRENRREFIDSMSQLRDSLVNMNRNLQNDMSDDAHKQRDELSKALENFRFSLENGIEKMVNGQKSGFAEMELRQKELVTSTEKRLDEMRNTVDEKLQKTLNERISESFRLVKEQLESVQQGLGEMKNLATDVGGLKNALTNVKIRGNFGELQLKSLLEQLMSPEQYVENVATIPNSSERVEFAIKLPGKEGSRQEVYLPIDSKFPKDIYDQLVEAQESADAKLIKEKQSQFVIAVQRMANDISKKYVAVPHTTDFGIMFVPVENIYAEVIRDSKLTQELRDKYHVLVTGPTTLGALLSSLQMGFRTLAIQKRSSEVWQTLAAIKTEFGKFSEMLAKAQKNLQTASGQLEELQGKRTRAIIRTLREVESLPEQQGQNIFLPDEEDEVENND
ncbi:MAG: DNA recombination protein RmuC [Bacteroidales bacterium]|nr:DNA recombination protein RmuC [Bacteroidales bacterium]